MKRLTLLLALVLIPTQALADCAWVVWEKLEYAPYPIPPGTKEWPSTGWKLDSAHETRAVCEKVLTAVHQVTLEHSQPGPSRPGIKEVKSAPGYVNITFQTKDGGFAGSATHTFRCLPDTIDPREKGGR